jgi:hypothetical protein
MAAVRPLATTSVTGGVSAPARQTTMYAAPETLVCEAPSETRPQVYGGIGTLTILDDDSAFFCADIGDVVEIPGEVVRRLGLCDCARLHVRLRRELDDAGGVQVNFVRVQAWHGLRAAVEAVESDQIVLRAGRGPRLVLPAWYSTDHDLAPGMVLDVVATPREGSGLPWQVAAVRRWPRRRAA